MEERLLELERLLRTGSAPGDLGTGAGEHEICDAEQSLGVSFPASYRWFLGRFGFACWPIDVAGVAPREPPYLRVVALTVRERTQVEPRLAPHLAALSGDGWGNHFCLDTSRITGDDCPVVFWNHELPDDQVPVEVAPGFIGWLEEAIKERIEDDEEEWVRYPGKGPRYLQRFLGDCLATDQTAVRMLSSQNPSWTVRCLVCECGAREFRVERVMEGHYARYVTATCRSCERRIEIPEDTPTWPRRDDGGAAAAIPVPCADCGRAWLTVACGFEYPAVSQPAAERSVDWIAEGVDDDALSWLAAAVACPACGCAALILSLEGD